MTFLVANKRRHSTGQASEQQDMPASKKQCVSPKPLLVNPNHTNTSSQNHQEQLVPLNDDYMNSQSGNPYQGHICKNSTSSHSQQPRVVNEPHSEQIITSNIYSYYHGSPIYNPSLTLEENPVYFSINKVLFEAHLESMTRRQGYLIKCKVGN